MAVSGVSGPWRGAYFRMQIATANTGVSKQSAGVTFYRESTPMPLVLVRGGVYAYNSGGAGGSQGQATGPATIDVQVNGTSIFSAGGIATATDLFASGNLTNSRGVFVASNSSITASYTVGSTAAQGITISLWGYVANHPHEVYHGSDLQSTGRTQNP